MLMGNTLAKLISNSASFSKATLSFMDTRSKGNPHNYEIFRECVSKSILDRSVFEKTNNVRGKRKPKSKQNSNKDETTIVPENENPEELAEFIEFIAWETFISFPKEVQSLSYAAIQNNSVFAERYSEDPPQTTLDALTVAVELSIPESLAIYGLIPESSDFSVFLHPILREYISTAVARPPAWGATRATSCEICERDWIPLTYHHLIPRGVHAKVLKRKWHEEWMLNSVAWLCRACHSFVHKMASNEELAREWYTVEKILHRDDIQNWARWVSKLRWKSR